MQQMIGGGAGVRPAEKRRRIEAAWDPSSNVGKPRFPGIPCSHLVKTGFCPKEVCEFSHDPKVVAQASWSGPEKPVPDKVPTEICGYFVSTGCKLGVKCKYAHGIDEYVPPDGWPELN